jgi:hypothetical protein
LRDCPQKEKAPEREAPPVPKLRDLQRLAMELASEWCSEIEPPRPVF